MAAPLLLTSGLERDKAVCHVCGTSLVCLLYAVAIVFQLIHGSDMLYEMRRRKRKPTPLRSQVIFNLQHLIGMV